MQTTTTVLVAAKTLANGDEVWLQCIASTGAEYVTRDLRLAVHYAAGAKPPKGYRLVRRKYTRELLGGGWINHQGTTH